MKISTILKDGLKRTNKSQKEIGAVNHFSKSAVSNYFNKGHVPTDVAIDIAKQLDDYDTSNAVASEWFDILKTFDGDRFEKDALSMDAFTDFENKQSHDAYVNDSIRKLIADNRVDEDEEASIDNFIDEELDNVIMRMGRLVALCKLRHETLMTVFRNRMEYYVDEHYMSKENLSKSQRLTMNRK